MNPVGPQGIVYMLVLGIESKLSSRSHIPNYEGKAILFRMAACPQEFLALEGAQCLTPEAGSRRPSYTPYGGPVATACCKAEPRNRVQGLHVENLSRWCDSDCCTEVLIPHMLRRQQSLPTLVTRCSSRAPSAGSGLLTGPDWQIL